MANFSPAVNTVGAIFTHADGIVLRPTYHVFDLFTNYSYEEILHSAHGQSPSLRCGRLSDGAVQSRAATRCSGYAGSFKRRKWVSRTGQFAWRNDAISMQYSRIGREKVAGRALTARTLNG